jgi:hypothetical protein
MFITTLAGLGSVLGIAGGINSLTGGGITSALGFGDSSPSGAQAQQMADPFSQYRSQLGAQYAGALAPGGKTDITQMPGYSQFESGVMQPSLEASQRKAAGAGMLYSGNEQQALQQTAQGGYYGFMTDYMNRLAQGSGAVQNPATGAGIGLGQGQYNQGNVMAGIGAIGQGLSGFKTPGLSYDPGLGYGQYAAGSGNTAPPSEFGEFGP